MTGHGISDASPADTLGPRRPSTRTRRVSKVQPGQAGRPAAPQMGKKLVIRRNTQHADKSPLPLKLRCLKAVEEYQQQIRARKDAQLRRQQEEISDREAHRKEMMTLIAKRMHRRGAQPLPRAAQAQTHPLQHPHPDTRMETNAANTGRHDSAGRHRLPQHVGVNKVAVEIDGHAKDIDVNACGDLHAFYQAVKDTFGPQINPEGLHLVYSVPGPTPAFRKILLNKMTPWRHFQQHAEKIHTWST
eukprot:jgi/Ulvmu1/4820/UM020_0105.1